MAWSTSKVFAAMLENALANARTKIAKDKIARGIHPANDSPTRPDLGTCGDCAHLVRRTAGNKRNLLKCPYHRLGTSSSEASDVRAGWPACIKFERRGDQ